MGGEGGKGRGSRRSSERKWERGEKDQWVGGKIKRNFN